MQKKNPLLENRNINIRELDELSDHQRMELDLYYQHEYEADIEEIKKDILSILNSGYTYEILFLPEIYRDDILWVGNGQCVKIDTDEPHLRKHIASWSLDKLFSTIKYEIERNITGRFIVIIWVNINTKQKERQIIAFNPFEHVENIPWYKVYKELDREQWKHWEDEEWRNAFFDNLKRERDARDELIQKEIEEHEKQT